MKKLIALILTLILAVGAVASCAKDNTQLKIGFMNGPTGLGMAKLINDNGGLTGNEKYSFEKFSNTNDATAALISGKLDMVCLPTADAAKIYNNEDAAIDVQVLALNCLNSLYVVAKNEINITSFTDLEGKTVLTCKNGTPKIILDALIKEYGINVTVVDYFESDDGYITVLTPQDIPPVIKTNNADIVIAPEPIVTSALMTSSNYSVKLDLGDVWDAKFDTPVAMGCIVARKDFVEEHKSLVKNFLNEYEASIEFMSNTANLEAAAGYAVDATIMAAAPAAKKAITNLGDAISYLDGKDMKNSLIKTYEVFGNNVIGGRLPDDDFYYGS